MNVSIVAISGRPPSWAQTAETFYCRQIRSFQLYCHLIKPMANIKKETLALQAHLPDKGFHVLLTDKGKMIDSEQFLEQIMLWLRQSPPLVFIIGGSSGVDQSIKRDAQLALSALTFPHTLARLILVEQLFRADCQLRAHPYPK